MRTETPRHASIAISVPAAKVNRASELLCALLLYLQ